MRGKQNFSPIELTAIQFQISQFGNPTGDAVSSFLLRFR